MKPRTSRLIGLLGGIAGALLFVYAIRTAGVPELLDGIRRVGWGLLFILAIGGVRFLIRAECWRLCMPDRLGGGTLRPLPFLRAWSAFLAGDALGSVTPLGLLASEPAKVFLTRHHLAPRESIASLALENLVYAASVATMIALGVLVLMTSIDVPHTWRLVALGALGAGALSVALAARLLRGTWDDARGARPRWRERVAHVRMSVMGFSAEYRARLWRVFLLDLVFHALAVAEIFVTLQWLVPGEPVTVRQAIVFEALNRVITVLFKFVPFRIGVDEALSGALAPLLAMDPVAGVALAVVRKIRNLFWSGVGLVITAAHPARSAATAARGAPATDRRENASVHRP